MLQLNLFQLEAQFQLKLDLKTCIYKTQIQSELEILKSDLIFPKTNQISEQIIKEKYLKDNFISKIINLIQTKT